MGLSGGGGGEVQCLVLQTYLHCALYCLLFLCNECDRDGLMQIVIALSKSKGEPGASLFFFVLLVVNIIYVIST